MSREEFEHLTGRYHNIIERIKELTEERDDIIDIDVDYELESIKRIEVNYRYLVALLQAHMPEELMPRSLQPVLKISKSASSLRTTKRTIRRLVRC